VLANTSVVHQLRPGFDQSKQACSLGFIFGESGAMENEKVFPIKTLKIHAMPAVAGENRFRIKFPWAVFYTCEGRKTARSLVYAGLRGVS
jgi:hypothetical protein